MIHTIKTKTGSVYEIDLDAWKFRRTAGRSRAGVPDFRDWTDYDALIVTANPADGLRLLRKADEKLLHTAPITEGHHELLWDAYHQSLAPAEGSPGMN